jgi:hypothetical protein
MKLRYFLAAAGFWFGLSALDLILTWIVLGIYAPHYGQEANPIARTILEQGGWSGLLIYKAALSGLAFACVWGIWRHRPGAALALLLTFIGLAAAACLRSCGLWLIVEVMRRT